MNAQVTLRSGDDQEIVNTSRPPEVGSHVKHNGKLWLVTACEYQLSHRIIPFSMVVPRAS